MHGCPCAIHACLCLTELAEHASLAKPTVLGMLRVLYSAQHFLHRAAVTLAVMNTQLLHVCHGATHAGVVSQVPVTSAVANSQICVLGVMTCYVPSMHGCASLAWQACVLGTATCAGMLHDLSPAQHLLERAAGTLGSR